LTAAGRRWLGSGHELLQVRYGTHVIALAIGYIGIATILCAAAIFGWLGIGQIALSGSDAIERDGLARGQQAPSWSLTDTSGAQRSSPPAQNLQLVIFADHSLKSFPSVAAGLRSLRDTDSALDIVVLTRGSSAGAAAVLAELGLADLPVLTGSAKLYASYNVRVMPYAIFVGSDGLVHGSSMVNFDWQLAKLRRIAALEIEPDEAARRPLFRLAA
jgi:hypothetical protein